MSLVFASIVPHPPILLPSVGSEYDREKVSATILAMEKLGEELTVKDPDRIIISSPHPDWGFDVPLFFLAQEFEGEVEKILIGLEKPSLYFDEGKDRYRSDIALSEDRIALIASGDLSHRLKEDGPYGLHPDGERFDKEFVGFLKKNDISNILSLDQKYPQAGECGLRSFSFLSGVLDAYGEKTDREIKTDIMSYEGPFGVGYLVANFKL